MIVGIEILLKLVDIFGKPQETRRVNQCESKTSNVSFSSAHGVLCATPKSRLSLEIVIVRQRSVRACSPVKLPT